MHKKLTLSMVDFGNLTKDKMSVYNMQFNTVCLMVDRHQKRIEELKLIIPTLNKVYLLTLFTPGSKNPYSPRGGAKSRPPIFLAPDRQIQSDFHEIFNKCSQWSPVLITTACGRAHAYTHAQHTKLCMHLFGPL